MERAKKLQLIYMHSSETQLLLFKPITKVTLPLNECSDVSIHNMHVGNQRICTFAWYHAAQVINNKHAVHYAKVRRSNSLQRTR